ncbi:hypothetical protein DE4585_03421 [Mycobacteroides salmoniphilum]|uniref:Deoxyribonuclease NucA/NucB domain-containing protein n=1 Tax=Mycobacteroides salmoniphilum TaxID=404941 RepID=A0A4R8S1P1_9MYCO|nr:hypothetical protein DE4585_03421 [Mycobacteroides salmoniphilum]
MNSYFMFNSDGVLFPAMAAKETSQRSKGKLVSVRECHRVWPPGRRGQGFLEAPSRRLPAVIKAVAVLAAVAIPLSAVQPGTPSGAPVRLASAQHQVDAAESAFEASPFTDTAPLSARQRSQDLPVDPEAGFTLQDGPQGTVQMVTADGLGQGRTTDSGHMVYADAGAGYTLIAGRTATGTRTVARLDQGSGPRSVTMFLRTPADTVMLGHTNGFVTINAATEAAPTLGMFTPAEARDSTGRIVQSSAVLQQVGPQLYQLSEVIVPDAQTAWPVYVDPGFMDFVKDPIGATKEVAASAVSAVSNVAEKVGDLSQQAASATWSGMKTVGNFVKENPLESAMIVGGVALSFTGVGSGAGAALIGAGVVNASATVMDAVAAHNPENQTLGNVALVLDTASLITPQGATKKVLKEGLEAVGEQAVKHVDDAVDVTKSLPVPTPKEQLRQDIPAAGSTPAVANPAEVPKTPRAPTEVPYGPIRPPTDYKPPTYSLPACTHLDCGHVSENPVTVYSKEYTPDTYDNKLSAIEEGRAPATVNREMDRPTINANRSDALRETPSARDWVRDEDSPASTQQGGPDARVRYVPHWEGPREGVQLSKTYKDQNIGHGDPYDRAFRGEDGKVRCATCEITRRAEQQRAESSAQQHRTSAIEGAWPQDQRDKLARTAVQVNREALRERPDSPDDQRKQQASHVQASTNQTRQSAVEHARTNNSQSGSNGGNNGHSSNSHEGSGGSHSKNNGSKNNKNKKGNGSKGNRAKRNRTGRR